MTRQWTGFGDKPAALVKWAAIVLSQQDIPRSLKARVHSSLAKGWLDRTEKGLQTARLHFIHRLYHAGKHANQAIALGLTSRAALKVAEKIESAGFRRPEDNTFPGYVTERFGRFTKLWEVLDAHYAKLAAEKLKREAKLFRDPMGYFCAAEDCGIAVKRRSTLKKCSGKCPQALKPRYCSEDCQRAVRFLSHTPNDGAYLPCRIGNAIGRSARRTLRYRASPRLTVGAYPPPSAKSSDRIPHRMRPPRDPYRAGSGPSA